MIIAPADVSSHDGALQTLAQEIRDELITVLEQKRRPSRAESRVVELTVSRCTACRPPKDKFVWDVSHQVYVHSF